MKLKNLAMVALAIVSMPSFGALTVSGITAKQRFPWNGLVDISFTVSGSLASGEVHELFTVAAKKSGGASIPISALSVADGANAVASVLSSGGNWIMTLTQAGTGRLVWNTASDVSGSSGISAVISINASGGSEPTDAGGVLWEGGPYWAACNLGAVKPEESGLWFWWGDTTGHRPADFNFSSANSAILTYGRSSSELRGAGWVTSAGVLASSHDGARARKGSPWRMPTLSEFNDLITNTDWSWTTRSGVKGYRVRGRGAYASRSIFLPVAGIGEGNKIILSTYGGYWTSGLTWDSNDDAWCVEFTSGYIKSRSDSHRYYGLTVRPVR